MSNSADLVMDFPRTTTSKKKQQRTVRFSTSTMSAMVCYNDRSSDNTTAHWYTHEDEQQFRQDNQDEAISYTMHKETRGSISNSAPMICPVGLEQQLISREYTKKRALMKRMAKFTVLREQARISSHSEHSDDKHYRIATASILCTQWAREQATTIGAFQARK